MTSGRPLLATDRLAGLGPVAKSDLNLEIRRNIYQSTGKDVTPANLHVKVANGDANLSVMSSGSLESDMKEPEKQFFCSSCGKDCTRVRYHNTKSSTNAPQGKAAAASKFDICPSCFLEARFPNSTQSSDYTKLENEKYSVIPDRERSWNDSETLLLLEGLEMFDDDWASVAEHVGTRTREQCVLKFLQLEIEDKYLEAEPFVEKGANPGVSNGGRTPYSQADNPVMSVIGFLAGTVDPRVAAAAAGRTVDEMHKVMQQQIHGDDDVKSTSTSLANASNSLAPDQSTLDNADAHRSTDIMDVDGDDAATATSTAPATNHKNASSALTPSDPTTTALALAAARSAALASHEERQMTSLLATATNLQLQKLELKLQQFGEMEALLQAERRDLERRRRELFLERLDWRRRCDAIKAGVVRGVSMGFGANSGEGMRTVMDALSQLGLGAEIGEDLGAMDLNMGHRSENGTATTAAAVEVSPLGPQDAGYRSYEI